MKGQERLELMKIITKSEQIVIFDRLSVVKEEKACVYDRRAVIAALGRIALPPPQYGNLSLEDSFRWFSHSIPSIMPLSDFLLRSWDSMFYRLASSVRPGSSADSPNALGPGYPTNAQIDAVLEYRHRLFALEESLRYGRFRGFPDYTGIEDQSTVVGDEDSVADISDLDALEEACRLVW